MLSFLDVPFQVLSIANHTVSLALAFARDRSEHGTPRRSVDVPCPMHVEREPAVLEQNPVIRESSLGQERQPFTVTSDAHVQARVESDVRRLLDAFRKGQDCRALLADLPLFVTEDGAPQSLAQAALRELHEAI